MSQASRRSFGRLAAMAMASAWVRNTVRVAMLFIAAGAGIAWARGIFDAEISAETAEIPAGISAPPSIASVCWCAVSAGVRPSGKGKVSKQVFLFVRTFWLNPWRYRHEGI